MYGNPPQSQQPPAAGSFDPFGQPQQQQFQQGAMVPSQQQMPYYPPQNSVQQTAYGGAPSGGISYQQQPLTSQTPAYGAPPAYVSQPPPFQGNLVTPPRPQQQAIQPYGVPPPAAPAPVAPAPAAPMSFDPFAAPPVNAPPATVTHFDQGPPAVVSVTDGAPQPSAQDELNDLFGSPTPAPAPSSSIYGETPAMSSVYGAPPVSTSNNGLPQPEQAPNRPVEEPELTPGMIGVVKPSDTLPFNSVSGFPKEKEMATVVLPMPEPCPEGKILAAPLLPRLMMPNFLFKFSLEHDKKKKMLSRHDSFSFSDPMGSNFHGIKAFEEHTKVGRSNRIVIKDNANQPFVLCRQKRNINKKYLIQAKYPLFQHDAAEDSEDGVAFYPWYMVRDVDDNNLNFRSLQIWNGKNYQPFLQIRNAKNPAKGEPLGKLRVPNKNDLRLTSSDDHNRVYALFSRKFVEKGGEGEKVTGWDVCVTPGTDVGLCAALALVLDDMVGWFA